MCVLLSTYIQDSIATGTIALEAACMPNGALSAIRHDERALMCCEQAVAPASALCVCGDQICV